MTEKKTYLAPKFQQQSQELQQQQQQLYVKVQDVARIRKWPKPRAQQQEALLALFRNGECPIVDSSTLVMYASVHSGRPKDVKCSLLKQLHRDWRARLSDVMVEFVTRAQAVHQAQAQAQADAKGASDDADDSDKENKDPLQRQPRAQQAFPNRGQVMAEMAELTPRARDSVTLLQRFGRYQDNVFVPSEWLSYQLQQSGFDPKTIEVMMRSAVPKSHTVSVTDAWRDALQVYNDSRGFLWNVNVWRETHSAESQASTAQPT